ncbi:MAG: hypothetical protein OEX08_00815 [Candidatus Nomurabacteria bacterium]|nr:hypothetical protein [Candidatus Nomurabacteria bacterium]
MFDTHQIINFCEIAIVILFSIIFIYGRKQIKVDFKKGIKSFKKKTPKGIKGVLHALGNFPQGL